MFCLDTAGEKKKYRCKKHSLSHQLTAQLHIKNSKNKKNGDKTFAAVDI